MRRLARWLGWTLAALVAVPLLLLLLVLLLANTSPGRDAIIWATPRFTGDMVRLTGLTGRFPDALRIAHIALRDAKGDYTTIDDAELDWSPLRLLQGQIVIDRLAAARIDAPRMPESSSSSSSGGFALPAPVILRELSVARIDIGAALAGTAAAVALQGSAELTALDAGSVTLTVRQLDGAGSYSVTGTVDAARLNVTLKAEEPERGLISAVAGLPDLGAIGIDATLDGPRNSVATKVALRAGPLRASVDGTVDLAHNAADLAVAAEAPAMQPRPDVTWQSVKVDARVRGPFSRPDATGQVRIDALTAAGASIGRITADIAGDAGRVRLNGELTGLRTPGPAPDLFAADPLTIQADARLEAPDRPVHLVLRHKLFNVEADALTGQPPKLDATLKLPDLTPFAALGQVPLEGGLDLTLHVARAGDAINVQADATVGVRGGIEQARSLVGDDGRLSVTATLRGNDLTLSQLRFTGRAAEMEASGRVAANRVDLAWSLALSDLAAAAPGVGGHLRAKGTATGTTDDLTLIAAIDGNVAAPGMKPGALHADVEARGLPNHPNGRITAQGDLLEAPLDLAVALRQVPDGLAVDIERAQWKSLRAEGAVQMPTATMVPSGNLRLTMTRLADLTPLVGRPIGGSIKATFQASAGAPQPVLDARIEADGLQAAGLGASLRASANGAADALDVKLDASLPNLQGAPARLNAAARVDTIGRTMNLVAFQADWRQQTLRLLAPARFAFSDGVAIDRLRVGLRQAVIEASGRAGSTLDVTASIRNLPVDMAAMFAPAYAADGTVQAEARITGTAARPSGRVRVTATGLRMRTGPGRAMPAANLTVTADLAGTEARIDTRLVAGPSQLTVTGRAPLGTAGALDLKTAGRLDLALLDPILAAGGRRVRGQITLDATVTGTVAAPNVAGTAQLAGGEVQDYGTGVHLKDIVARVQGNGGMVRIAQLTAKAGQGTISAAGTVDLTAPGMPVDLTLTSREAQPLASDLITVVIDTDLTLKGEAAGQLTAGGRVRVRRADIRIPERMPVSIAVLPIRQPGAKRAAPPAPATSVALDLTLEAREVFIRGRGVQAEFGGAMKVGGTTAAPRTQGGLELRRGDISVAGRSLQFQEGLIDFNGGSISDPALRLVANSTSGSVTATLTITGTASNPKIALTSTPPLPQDEVLAQLLFGSSVGKLSAFEVAEIAAALATLTGSGGGIGDPLDKVRQGLGLDRLSLGSGAGGSPALEAGRYIAPRLYLGARQSASGGTQATVQYDLMKGLKLEGTTGAGGGSATGTQDASNGTSVGITYQFEY